MTINFFYTLIFIFATSFFTSCGSETDSSKELAASSTAATFSTVNTSIVATCLGSGCHNSKDASGELGLSATDSDANFTTLLENDRVDTASPSTSKLLQKVSAKVSHGGGTQFSSTSAEYANILSWIKAGAKK